MSILIFFLFAFEACLYMDRKDAKGKCSYMLIKYPRMQGSGRPECYEIESKLVQTPDFKASYDFLRLIQSYHPANLTLVVVAKSKSTPIPILIRSGKTGDHLYRPVKHTVDYNGQVHRYTFGRYAASAIGGIRQAEDWHYRLVLAIDKQR